MNIWKYMDARKQKVFSLRVDDFDSETLPPNEAFHTEDITEENYEYCQNVWRHHDKKMFRDFLIRHNNIDVVPILEALQIQF